MPQTLKSSYHPLSTKGMANRSSTTCYVNYSIFSQSEQKKFCRWLLSDHHAAFSTQGRPFYFPCRAVRGSLAAGRPVCTGRGGAGLVAVAGALLFPAGKRNRPGLRCAAARFWRLLMVSRYLAASDVSATSPSRLFFGRGSGGGSVSAEPGRLPPPPSNCL